MQRDRQRPLRAAPSASPPTPRGRRAQLVVQPRRRAPLGVACRGRGPRSGRGPRRWWSDGGHGQRAIIPRPVASAAVTAATDPVFAGLARQAELIAAGELSSRELTEAYLERIARLDPTLNAFRVVFAERALAEADQADGRRRGGDAPPAARRAGRDQGRHRRRRRGHRARLATPTATRARRGRRGRAPAARRRRRDHRQDQRPGAGDRRRSPRRRRSASPATRGTSTARRAARAAARPPRSRPASSAARSAPTAAARSASPPAAAACSASSRSATGSRSRRSDEPWHGLSVYGPLTRHVADAALFLDATGDGEPLAPRRRRATPGSLRIARLDDGRRRRSSASPDAEQRGARRRRARSCCAASATSVVEREIPTTAPTGAAFTARYFARHPRRGARDAATPSGSRAAPRGFRGSAARSRAPRSQRARARGGRRRARDRRRLRAAPTSC